MGLSALQRGSDHEGGRGGGREVDMHVARRVRERRRLLGLTQQGLAELVGVTCQQMHKYEVGLSRMSVGRLAVIARTLGVEASAFYEGLGSISAPAPIGRRRMVELARSFAGIRDPRLREALCEVARALAGEAEAEIAPGPGEDEAATRMPQG